MAEAVLGTEREFQVTEKAAVLIEKRVLGKEKELPVTKKTAVKGKKLPVTEMVAGVVPGTERGVPGTEKEVIPGTVL